MTESLRTVLESSEDVSVSAPFNIADLYSQFSKHIGPTPGCIGQDSFPTVEQVGPQVVNAGEATGFYNPTQKYYTINKCLQLMKTIQPCKNLPEEIADVRPGSFIFVVDHKTFPDKKAVTMDVYRPWSAKAFMTGIKNNPKWEKIFLGDGTLVRIQKTRHPITKHLKRMILFCADPRQEGHPPNSPYVIQYVVESQLVDPVPEGSQNNSTHEDFESECITSSIDDALAHLVNANEGVKEEDIEDSADSNVGVPSSNSPALPLSETTSCEPVCTVKETKKKPLFAVLKLQPDTDCSKLFEFALSIGIVDISFSSNPLDSFARSFTNRGFIARQVHPSMTEPLFGHRLNTLDPCGSFHGSISSAAAMQEDDDEPGDEPQRKRKRL